MDVSVYFPGLDPGFVTGIPCAHSGQTSEV
jgi:hypothetical protein